MYFQKLIACVKSQGKVLREKNNIVYLPFGDEYTLWFKNENTKKVKIMVSIDGTDVLFGKSLILKSNETFDLKGFVKDIDGNDNRSFKFITKTQEISNFRGDKIEDGLIKITYQFEAETILSNANSSLFTNYNHKQQKNINTPVFNPFWYSEPQINNPETISRTINCNINASCQTFDTNNYINYSNNVNTISDDPGITVEGTNTNQSFKPGNIDILEPTIYNIIFQLKGLKNEEEIITPVTVQTKKLCSSCGKKFPSDFEYCPHDGTYLRFN